MPMSNQTDHTRIIHEKFLTKVSTALITLGKNRHHTEI